MFGNFYRRFYIFTADSLNPDLDQDTSFFYPDYFGQQKNVKVKKIEYFGS
jgi:hypothetical protein